MKFVPQEYTQRQVVVLTIYALLSLPLLPLMAVAYPFSKWVTRDANNHEEIELTMVEFLSLSMAMSLFMYFFASMMYCFPPPHH
jgi:hypothetical protein